MVSPREIKVCTLTSDDNEIVAKIQKGEVEFFDCIIERYRQRLFLYVMRFVKNTEESHDLVQIVFIKTLNNIHSYDTEKKFSSWIYRIAHNETMNWFGKNNQRKTISIENLNNARDCLETADTAETVLEQWFYAELQDDLESALVKLPKQYAKVLRMKYFEDKSYKEISEELNKPTNTVGTLLRRAKKRLLTIIKKSHQLQ